MDMRKTSAPSRNEERSIAPVGGARRALTNTPVTDARHLDGAPVDGAGGAAGGAASGAMSDALRGAAGAGGAVGAFGGGDGAAREPRCKASTAPIGAPPHGAPQPVVRPAPPPTRTTSSSLTPAESHLPVYVSVDFAPLDAALVDVDQLARITHCVKTNWTAGSIIIEAAMSVGYACAVKKSEPSFMSKANMLSKMLIIIAAHPQWRLFNLPSRPRSRRSEIGYNSGTSPFS
ncbi:hypothetical protein KFE25_011198 [Diacronema lutheri]|uniref:Uncharacterized protein n=1 Tax=Diacronema lutheri TaxID=2081491 RepID=A0A8J5XCU9_DIALT|nr:hypothetical protein KFE25_011198 [Diacronema lutheri]